LGEHWSKMTIYSCSRLQDTTLGLGDAEKQHTLNTPYSGMGSKLSIVTLINNACMENHGSQLAHQPRIP